MSTLGTFSEYANFGLLSDIEQARQRMEPGYADKRAKELAAKSKAANPMIQGKKASNSSNAARDARYAGRRARVNPTSAVAGRPSAEAKALMPAMKVTKQSKKSKEAVANSLGEIAKKKGLKMRNLGVGIGLGTAGLAGLGAIAYNNRNSRRSSEMSFDSAFANFAKKSYGEVTDEMRAGTGKALTQEQSDKLAKVKEARKTGKFDADQIKATQTKLKNYAGQRTVEKNIDSGNGIYKGAKGMDYVTRTGALLGSPERGAIAAGKKSKNDFVKGLATNAEKFGRAGYKTGAIGGRGVLNNVVGRTATGKVARLGAAGIGLSAIGGAMKRNRQERG